MFRDGTLNKFVSIFFRSFFSVTAMAKWIMSTLKVHYSLHSAIGIAHLLIHPSIAVRQKTMKLNSPLFIERFLSQRIFIDWINLRWKLIKLKIDSVCSTQFFFRFSFFPPIFCLRKTEFFSIRFAFHSASLAYCSRPIVINKKPKKWRQSECSIRTVRMDTKR